MPVDTLTDKPKREAEYRNLRSIFAVQTKSFVIHNKIVLVPIDGGYLLHTLNKNS